MNPVKKLCGKRHMTTDDLAEALHMPQAELVLAITGISGYDRCRTSVAAWFGFPTWTALVSQVQADEFTARTGRLMYCDTDLLRLPDIPEPRTELLGQRSGVKLWRYGSCWYIDYKTDGRKIRVQRFTEPEARVTFEKAADTTRRNT